MENVEFRIRGENSEALATELSELIQQAFGMKPQQEAFREEKRGDALVIVGVILMLPPALESSMNFWNSAEGSKKAKALFDWAKSKLGSDGDDQVTVVSQDGVVRDFENLNRESMRLHLSPPKIED